jgi:hypothetical protein
MFSQFTGSTLQSTAGLPSAAAAASELELELELEPAVLEPAALKPAALEPAALAAEEVLLRLLGGGVELASGRLAVLSQCRLWSSSGSTSSPCNAKESSLGECNAEYL